MAVVAALTVTRAYASSPPTLLVLRLDMVDTSGETPPRTAEHEQRLKVLDSCLSKALTGERIYTIIGIRPRYSERSDDRHGDVLWRGSAK